MENFEMIVEYVGGRLSSRFHSLGQWVTSWELRPPFTLSVFPTEEQGLHLHVTECCVKGKNQVFTQRRSMLQIWSSLINDWEPEPNLNCFTFEDLIFVSNFTGSLNFLIISTLTRKYETLSTWSQMSGLCCSWSWRSVWFCYDAWVIDPGF